MTGFTFDGRAIAAAPGQSIAAALTAAGVRAFRETAKGGRRGIFCGIGVCQDCLVTVDGVPNRRACMTPAAEAVTVATQVPFPALDTARSAPARAAARTILPDVLVIGGGAAGLSAAIAARAAGASVALIDERKVSGGQYFKQPAAAAALDAQQSAGAALVARAEASGAELIGEVEVWGAFDGLLFLAAHRGTALVARPKAAVVATGAFERPIIVPGWTLPGVMTTGAAQTLWRSYRTLPGRRVAVCGSGPLNLQVALELARAGAEVAFVAEAAAPTFARPSAALALAAAGPRLALAGVAMLAGLRARGVPVRHRTRLVAVEEAADGLVVTVEGPAGRTGATVDAVLMNAGFEPQNDILRLLGAAMDYDADFGHLRCRRDDRMATSVEGLFAAGDCAGLGGAPAAMAEGRIAGRAAAAAAGLVAQGGPAGARGSAGDDAADRAALAMHRRFQRVLWRLHDIGPRLPEGVPDDTLICRCEEITAGEVRAGLAATPGHAGTLKRATRLGMGRCQGRYCGGVAARFVAAATGQPVEDRSHFAPRVPIKPVAIAVILAAEEALTDAHAVAPVIATEPAAIAPDEALTDAP